MSSSIANLIRDQLSKEPVMANMKKVNSSELLPEPKILSDEDDEHGVVFCGIRNKLSSMQADLAHVYIVVKLGHGHNGQNTQLHISPPSYPGL